MILKKIKSLTLLLIIVVAFFDNSAKAQTFPLTNLIVHGWQKIDVLPYGVADTTIYKSVIWNKNNGKLYKIGTMGGGGSVDSLFVTYCCGCVMNDGWKALEDTIKIDTCYVNTIIKDSLSNHYDLIHALDTGKVSTSGDVMYGDLTVNADVHADTVHATVKQSVYLNSLASWDSQGVLNDTIIPKNVSDTLYNKIVAIRPNKPDTSFANIDLIANITLFPKGTYFHVHKGSYTATVNIARDSCVQYYDAGATVTKATSGAMFDYTGMMNPINILGKGIFVKTNVGAVISDYIYGTVQPKNGTIEFDSILNTKDNGVNLSQFYLVDGSFRITGRCIYSSANIGICLFATPNSNNYINVSNIVSTANTAIYLSGNANVISTNCIGAYMKNGYVYAINSDNGNQIYNVGVCTGIYSYYYNGGINITYNGNVTNVYNGDYRACSKLIINGKVTNLVYNNSSLNVNGNIETFWNNALDGISYINGDIYALRANSGYLQTKGIYQATNAGTLIVDYFYNYASYLSNTAGYCKINRGELFFDCNNYQVSGGTVEVNGSAQPTTISCISVTNGGKLILRGNFLYNLGRPDGAIHIINNGILDLENATVKCLSTAKYGMIVFHDNTGTLILNSSTLIKKDTYSQFINCLTSPHNILVYSGGVTTNGTTGDLLSAKSRKDSVKVTAVATTTIVLNDGSGGAETFTETDVATYNTVDLMAARMASLINASGTLAITATYVSGNTFNIESDVAGTNYTQSGLINLTNLQLRLNSYAITDVVGGTIIEDSDVTY